MGFGRALSDLLPEAVGQHEHALREVFNGLRYVIKTEAPWRWMPNNLPPWAAVYQQAQRWLAAGCFETPAEDLRVILRVAAGRKAEPSAAILDSCETIALWLSSDGWTASVLRDPECRQ